MSGQKAPGIVTFDDGILYIGVEDFLLDETKLDL